jgi:hypothetical protein
MSAPHRPTILVAPLDWGMGHATRCIPIIQKLQQQGAMVVVACPPQLEARLRSSISGVSFVSLRGYEILYHRHLPVWVSVILQAWKIHRSIIFEHQWILENASRLGIQQIISDNRYGLWHPDIPSVLVTHQLQPIAPFGGRIASGIIKLFMRKLLKNFTEIHVPDHEGPNRLSGKLSEPFDGLPPVKFIGPLSRFTQRLETPAQSKTMLAILSGPEPHYSRFFHAMKARAAQQNLHFKALGWKIPAGSNEDEILLNLSDEEFATEVLKAEKIVCSAGYSTLCDLVALGKRADVFPTKGQTEQAYLAKRWLADSEKEKLRP